MTTAPEVRREPFGTLPDGRNVDVFTFRNPSGIEARVLSYGGIVASLLVPGRDGTLADVVLGYDDLDGYVRGSAYLGAIVGRCANRIARGRFVLDGQEVQLPLNDGPNHIHGGPVGFDRAVWRAEPFADRGGRGVVLTLRSPDGDQGYPGALDVRVTCTLTDDDALAFEYEATSDRPTIVNLTQHSYFNLAGAGAGDILDHELSMHAPHYTPVDERLVPTGEIVPVVDTPFDFRRPARIGARIDAPHEQLQRGRGYDHNFALSRTEGGLALAARLVEHDSGRVMEVHTTEPGVQLYTGNFLDGITGKEGKRYVRRAGVCLETQHFPDAPNHVAFPSIVLRPGASWRSETVFAFSTAG